MKYLLSLIPIQVLAIADPYITKSITKWTSIHYDTRPTLIYHILIYIVFGICIPAVAYQWKNVSVRMKWLTLVFGIVNIAAVIYAFVVPYQIPALAIILIGMYVSLAVMRQRKN